MNFIKKVSMIAASALLVAAVFSATGAETTTTSDNESLALFVSTDNVAFADAGGDETLDPAGGGGTCIFLPFLTCYTGTLGNSRQVRHYYNWN